MRRTTSRAARQRQAEAANETNRWVLSYADLITLLFALFVVMYSMSTVNEGKYRVLAETLEESFIELPTEFMRILPGQFTGGGEGILDGGPEVFLEAASRVTEYLDNALVDEQAEPSAEDLERVLGSTRYQSLETLRGQLFGVLDGEVDTQVRVISRGEWLEIELDSKLLFAVADAELREDAQPTLQAIVGLLTEHDNVVRVEGHTDNVPITGPRYASNWELSAARAATTARFLVGLGLSPERLSAIGYGEFRPVAENVTEEGRARNRRVVIAVGSEQVTLAESGAVAPRVESLDVPWQMNLELPAARSLELW